MGDSKEDTVVFQMDEGPADPTNLNLSNISKEEMLRMIGYGINSGAISIKDIVQYIVPKKQRVKKVRTSDDKKMYYKSWYERNKGQVIERVKRNQQVKQLNDSVSNKQHD
jgi:hypothetical protein